MATLLMKVVHNTSFNGSQNGGASAGACDAAGNREQSANVEKIVSNADSERITECRITKDGNIICSQPMGLPSMGSQFAVIHILNLLSAQHSNCNFFRASQIDHLLNTEE